MLVDDYPDRLMMLEAALVKEGHIVVARLDTQGDLAAAVARTLPDIILIDVDAPSRDTLESLALIDRDQPRPIVLFAASSDSDTIRRAMHAGVSSYVADGMKPDRVKAVMDVAIARFERYQALKKELEETKTKLADRKDIERAKGLLMQRRGLDEKAAHEMLRKMSMARNLKLGEAARALIAAAELL